MRLLFHASYASPAIDTTNVPTERALRDREADGSFYAPDRSHSPGQVLISLSVVSEARVRKLHTRARRVCALSIQRLEGSRPRFAADAGPMHIQWWEGAAWRCAEAVPQSAARDRMRPETGCCGKGSVKTWFDKLEK